MNAIDRFSLLVVEQILMGKNYSSETDKGKRVLY